jgi:hypothetical protein
MRERQRGTLASVDGAVGLCAPEISGISERLEPQLQPALHHGARGAMGQQVAILEC